MDLQYWILDIILVIGFGIILYQLKKVEKKQDEHEKESVEKVQKPLAKQEERMNGVDRQLEARRKAEKKHEEEIQEIKEWRAGHDANGKHKS